MIRLTKSRNGEITVKIREWDGQKTVLIEQDGHNGPTDLVSIDYSDVDDLIAFLQDQKEIPNE